MIIMALEKQPFRKYNLDEEKEKPDTFTVRLNKEERADLEACKKILNQTKDSTAFKQLATIGSKVLHDPKTATIINTIFGNKRKNERLGIIEFD